MFTGIIQTVGKISKIEPRGEDVRLTIESGALDFSDVAMGDSIAVNGVCLTVIAMDKGQFTVDVSAESLRCTQGLDRTGPVNLEKAMRLADRLGGHLVSGHVDGVGEITGFAPVGDCYLLEIRAPESLRKFIAPKGSITVNGVSLTVNHVNKDKFDINLIPHTIENTTFKNSQIGDKVNLEADMVARYVDQLLSYRKEQDA